MNHIHDLIIHRFRGLRDLPFNKCAGFNLIVGNNNRGKTSVLEAIALSCMFLDVGNWDGVSRIRQVRSYPMPWPNRMRVKNPEDRRRMIAYDRSMWIRWMFPQGPDVPDPDLYCGALAIERTSAYGQALHFATMQEELLIGGESEPDDDQFMPPKSRTLRMASSIPVFDHALLKHVDDPWNLQSKDWGSVRSAEVTFEDRPMRRGRERTESDLRWSMVEVANDPHMERGLSILKRQGLDEALFEVLRHIDHDIIDADILMDGDVPPGIYLKSKTTNMAPLSSYGDGFRRVFEIAIAMAGAQDGVLLIDEIERGLHFHSLEQCMPWIDDMAQRLRVQIFATTHSIEAVDAILGVHSGKTPSASDLRLFKLPAPGDEIVNMGADQARSARTDYGWELR